MALPLSWLRAEGNHVLLLFLMLDAAIVIIVVVIRLVLIVIGILCCAISNPRCCEPENEDEAIDLSSQSAITKSRTQFQFHVIRKIFILISLQSNERCGCCTDTCTHTHIPILYHPGASLITNHNCLQNNVQNANCLCRAAHNSLPLAKLCGWLYRWLGG